MAVVDGFYRFVNLNVVAISLVGIKMIQFLACNSRPFTILTISQLALGDALGVFTCFKPYR